VVFLKRALLAVLGLAVLAASIAGAVYGNFAWKRHQELSLFTQFDDWRWQYFWGGVQMRVYSEPGDSRVRTMLRKVYAEDGYQVIASTTDDTQTILMTLAFEADCAPGERVETSREWDDGSTKQLVCNESGSQLEISTDWAEGRTWWGEDFDGYQVAAGFSNWDFEPLRREFVIDKVNP